MSSIPLPSQQRPFVDPENPTYEECRAFGFQFLKPGKQCPHPVSSWFRDPRPLPTPSLRSRRDILSQLYREHTTAPKSRQDAVLAHYIPREDPLPKTDDQRFTLFPLLPPEIRQQIWEIALASNPRTIDLRELRHNKQYTSIRHVAPLPVPHIARACRESRDVVFRLGCRLALLCAPTDGPEISSRERQRQRQRRRNGIPDLPAFKKYPVGFFIKGVDIPLCLPDLDRRPEEPEYSRFVVLPAGLKEDGGSGESNVAVEEGECTSGIFIQSLKCRSVALNFPGHHGRSSSRAPGMGGGGGGPGPSRRDPILAYASTSGLTFLEDWSSIMAYSADHPASGRKGFLDTVYIYHKSRFIDVSLRVDEEFTTHLAAEEGNGNGGTEPFYEVEMQLLVDLYDDERLAELASLETLKLDADNDTPRYASPGAANPGLCLNCERVQWETYTKPEVEAFWLGLHVDELQGEEDGVWEAVNTGDDRPGVPPLPYNPDHPWVKEKLRNAPEFRCAVIVHIRIAEEARLRNDAHEQWADYNSRVQAIR